MYPEVVCYNSGEPVPRAPDGLSAPPASRPSVHSTTDDWSASIRSTAKWRCGFSHDAMSLGVMPGDGRSEMAIAWTTLRRRSARILGGGGNCASRRLLLRARRGAADRDLPPA